MILARRFLVTGTRRQPESRRRVRGFAAFLRTGAGAVDKDGEPGGLRRRRSGGVGQVSQPGQDLREQERNEHMLAVFGDLLRAAKAVDVDAPHRRQTLRPGFCMAHEFAGQRT